MPELLELYAKADTAVFQYVCSRVLGDAGTSECFERIIEELSAHQGVDRNNVIHYCDVLTTWGRLSVVPVILEQYTIVRREQPTMILPMLLSSLLEDREWGPIAEEPEIEELDDYVSMVMARYDELKRKFSTDRVLIFDGRRWGVIPFARLILHRVAHPEFDHTYEFDLRRRLEASTGINCSAFFKDEVFQPLAAAAIVEEFLGGPEVVNYEDGVRYFFGHRIPD